MPLKEEQRLVIDHNEGNILVSASAGSGKTFVMIERLIRLVLERKATVKQMLAVTFTEKAAFEMKEKLKKAILDKLTDDNDYLADQLAEVSTADICTLHSLLVRIIRTYFYIVGLSPDFKICDEFQNQTIKAECINKVFRKAYEQGEEWFISLTDKFLVKRSDASFKKTIISLFDTAEVFANPEDFYGLCKNYFTNEGISHLIKEYKEQLDKVLDIEKQRAEEILIGFTDLGLGKSIQFIKDLIADVELVLNGDLYTVKQFEKYERALSFERNLDGVALSLKEQATEIRDNLKKIFKKFSGHITDAKQDAEILMGTRETAEGIIELLKRFAQAYSEEKREENLLDFSDLEHFAIKILQNESVRNEILRKYKYVFVDEYQDINEAQEEIILRLSDNNLFMVGDVKQSIYGFRGCRPEIFQKKMQKMQQEGQATVSLNYNFRSSLNVIQMVNLIFSYSMTEKRYGVSYEKNSKLIEGGIFLQDKVGRAKLHLLKKGARKISKKEEPRIYNILDELDKKAKDEECDESTLITKIINNELGEKYYDTKTGEEKYVNFGDITILTREKNNKFVQGIVKGLTSHGIPVSSEVKQNMLEFPEISLLVNLLKLLSCFKQDIPLVIVMKSTIGGFSEENLAEIVSLYKNIDKKCSFYDAFIYYLEKGEGELNQKVKEFYEYINKIRFLSDFLGAKGILEKVIADTNLEEYLLCERQGLTKVKRLKRFLSLAQVNGKTLSVKKMLDKIENSYSAFEIYENAQENTVKIMTIHASKGLEFPVTIVCGLERHANSEEEHADILTDKDMGFAVKFYDKNFRTKKETLLRGVIKQRLKEKQIKEELRLFYVALTRARYSLHLVCQASKDDRKEEFTSAVKFLDYIPKHIPMQEYEASDFEFENLSNGNRKILIGKGDEEQITQIKQNLSYEYPFIKETSLPLKSSVTKASRYEDGEYGYVIFDNIETINAEKGILAHKILENLDFYKKEKVNDVVKRLTEQGVISQSELDGLNLERIQNAINNPIFDIDQTSKVYKEQGFIVEIPANKILDTTSDEKVTLQGVIDLLIVSNGHAKIIDYKYSALKSDGLKNKYQKQLQLYSYAVEKVLKIKVSESVIVNIFTGETVNIG